MPFHGQQANASAHHQQSLAPFLEDRSLTWTKDSRRTLIVQHFIAQAAKGLAGLSFAVYLEGFSRSKQCGKSKSIYPSWPTHPSLQQVHPLWDVAVVEDRYSLCSAVFTSQPSPAGEMLTCQH